MMELKTTPPRSHVDQSSAAVGQSRKKVQRPGDYLLSSIARHRHETLADSDVPGAARRG